MKENTTKDKIVIPVQIERLKLWLRRALETMGWLISIGLLTASVAVTVVAAIIWFIWGSETIFALGLGGGILLGLAGVWHLLHRLDRAVSQLR